jgi:hypothetical protein
MQLLGSTALFVAAKFNEINFPSIDLFVTASDKGIYSNYINYYHIKILLAFTKSDLLNFELELLTTINFQLNFPSSLVFLYQYLLVFDIEKEQLDLMYYLLEVTLLE